MAGAAVTAVVVAWFGLLLGLTGIGAIYAVVVRMVTTGRGGLR